MKTTKITIGRLYNLGSYEHIRYEISVEVADGASPSKAMLGLERILAALNPRTSTHSKTELAREQRGVDEMRRCLTEDGPDKFQQRYGGFVGTPEEYIARCQESVDENVTNRHVWEARAARAREMLDDLGGAAEWKDAKLDWENDDL